MDLLKRIHLFLENKTVLLLVFLYFILRLPKLTLIPIFNDEAIYLDWAWRETHVPGFLYYSLYDAKQPLVMWIYGIFSNFFSDPLFAGRFVSLCFGLLSTIGIYLIGKELFEKRVGFVAALFYIVIPIFALFDRQALLESAITTTGIWGFYFFNRSLKKERSIVNELLMGLVLGLGFFSKSTALLFLLTTVLVLSYLVFKTKKQTYLLRLWTIGGAFLFTIILLIINPLFWTTLSTNTRYVLGINELIRFPVQVWAQNAWAFLQILFLFLTPIVFVLSFVTVFESVKKRKNVLLLIWLGVPILIAIITLKTPSQRYVVGLLPLLTLFTATTLIALVKRSLNIGIITMIFTFFLTTIFFYFLVYKPILYFSFSNKITPYSEFGFVDGQVSGYGITEVVDFLELENKKRPIVITFAENTGNPESSLSVYSFKKNIANGYFELRYLIGLPRETECIEMENGARIYFVSRNDQLAGFERFTKKIKSIKKPLSNESVGIYEFISGCKKVMKVNPVFHGTKPS